MAQKSTGVRGSPTAWETYYSNILSKLDSIAIQIVENTDDADFWKEDLDLREILFDIDCPENTFRANHGYIRLEKKDGIKNAGKLTIDFNPKQYYDGRDRNGNI